MNWQVASADLSGVTVRRLSPSDAIACVPALAELLIDCVEGGASVSFMLPMTVEKATRFWHTVADGVARGERALLGRETKVERSSCSTPSPAMSPTGSTLAPAGSVWAKSRTTR